MKSEDMQYICKNGKAANKRFRFFVVGKHEFCQQTYASGNVVLKGDDGLKIC
jgi:hypothetical protein